MEANCEQLGDCSLCGRSVPVNHPCMEVGFTFWRFKRAQPGALGEMVADEQDHQDALWICMHCAERLGSTRNIDVMEKVRRIAREVLRADPVVVLTQQEAAKFDEFGWLLPGGSC